VLTNTTLRPLTYKLRPELTPRPVNYDLDLICATKDESHVRALLVNDLDRNRLLLKGLTE
jgi:hypothetical protein